MSVAKFEEIHRAIIVDDKAAVRLCMRAMLRLAGLECAGEYSTANQALKDYQWLKPKIVFTDLVMPGMTGFEFIRQLKVFDSKVNVIVITGLMDLGAEEAARGVGAAAYLIKPVSAMEIKTAVEQVLAGQFYSPYDSMLPYSPSQADAALAFPSFLTHRLFYKWDQEKSVPGFYFKLAEKMRYRVSCLADYLGLSRRGSHNEWGACFGMPPGDLLHQVRIKQGVYSLWQGMKPSEVATRLYYKWRVDFCRAFKQTTGLTISGFLRKAQSLVFPGCPKCQNVVRKVLPPASTTETDSRTPDMVFSVFRNYQAFSRS